ncbi:hypothetical protein CTAYLR_003461 [Chrysophaeum taylorii]|uniref:Uncharacterized protein n=1 Tax=Chrysophaeum taylorii TaxID=2483200 RepID=A0AAD7U917_9STRA|nr:hypothetical protein CTAYLR_003461 [Chrysophaeum taylorii]
MWWWLVLGLVSGVAPSAELRSAHERVYAAPAAFGRIEETMKFTLRRPVGLADGCEPQASSSSSKKEGLFAARSPNCSFSDRAVAAKAAGFAALVVYNTIEGIYQNRSRAKAGEDFECENGKATASSLKGKWEGFPSECPSECESGRCLLTGNGLEICCAWDLYTTMGGAKVDLPSVFVTMRDADKLSEGKVELSLIQEPFFTWSSVLIWVLGVATCAASASRSARFIAKSRTSRFDFAGEDDESFELSTAHAFGFVCVASAALLLLFYVDAYAVVVVAFALSGASSTARVVWRPLLSGIPKPDLAAGLVGCAVAVWWLVARHAAYAWILQDLFGVCLCVVFLDVIKLRSLEVATVLLSMAFCYDVFFVFFSPYVFGQSVMVKVATGTGPKKDADYCEKYPDDSDCQSTQLPMLLLIPRDQSGYSMLGLGDVVLPGLLVSFCARYDAAANRSRYFPACVFGYAIGLACANLAVAVFKVGQPALLYLVPCTLGLVYILAKLDHTFDHLWKGPPDLLPLPSSSSPPPSSSPPEEEGDLEQQEEAPAATEKHALLKISI